MRQEMMRRRQHTRERSVGDVEAETTEHAPTTSTLKDEMDEMLDEIDEVLEQNAEEFVAGYVQKGGQ
jgi:ubiquitin-like protein Pup